MQEVTVGWTVVIPHCAQNCGVPPSYLSALIPSGEITAASIARCSRA